jgi:hypothetical protein
LLLLLLLLLCYLVLGDQQPYHWHLQQRCYMLQLASGLPCATAVAKNELMLLGQPQDQCCWLLQQR